MSETDYLLASPANAERLLESIRALETGKGLIRTKLSWLEAKAPGYPAARSSKPQR